MNFNSIRNQSCVRESCPFFKKVGQGNICIHARNPLRFRCHSCEKTWGAEQSSPYFGLHRDIQKVERAFKLLETGQSIRKVAQILKVSPSTIQRWKKRLTQKKREGMISPCQPNSPSI